MRIPLVKKYKIKAELSKSQVKVYVHCYDTCHFTVTECLEKGKKEREKKRPNLEGRSKEGRIPGSTQKMQSYSRI